MPSFSVGFRPGSHLVFDAVVLNNNYHLAHHDLPHVPWFALREIYESSRQQYVERSGGFLVKGYSEWLRRYSFAQVAHPVYKAASGTIPGKLGTVELKCGADLTAYFACARVGMSLTTQRRLDAAVIFFHFTMLSQIIAAVILLQRPHATYNAVDSLQFIRKAYDSLSSLHPMRVDTASRRHCLPKQPAVIAYSKALRNRSQP